MKSRNLIAVAALAWLAMLSPSAQERANETEQWARVRFLLGSWEGATEGQPGKGTARRRYQLVLRQQFIEVRNTTSYPPQEKNPKGEIHDDVGFISYDKTRKAFVLRQFHGEGFVNQYVEDPSVRDVTIAFTSESIENIPAGWRARESYIVRGPDQFEEIFELAPAGKPFEVYSRSKFTRVPTM